MGGVLQDPLVGIGVVLVQASETEVAVERVVPGCGKYHSFLGLGFAGCGGVGGWGLGLGVNVRAAKVSAR